MGGNAQRVEEMHARLSYRVLTGTVGSTQKHNLALSQCICHSYIFQTIAKLGLVKINVHRITVIKKGNCAN